jgi:hypothetical protein
MGEISMVRWPKTPAEEEELKRAQMLAVADRVLGFLNARSVTPTREEIAAVIGAAG